MRMFELHRAEDETGVSGTGLVAEGVQFGDRRAVIRWISPYASTVVWDSIEDAMYVHGHGGKTQVVWLDEY